VNPVDGIVDDIMAKTGLNRESAQASLVVAGILSLALMTGERKGPAWRKDLPPVGGPRAGAWRGKGSFGTHFGPQTSHR